MKQADVVPFALSCLLALLLVGCAGTPPTGPQAATPAPTGPRMAELNLVASPPVAVNLGTGPEPNGFSIRVFAMPEGQVKAQPITSGVLEVLMFEGAPNSAALRSDQYRHLWSFPANELRAYAATSRILGTGYNLSLAWGADHPRQSRVSLILRYRPPQGPPVYSLPSVLTVGSQ